jgi:cold shock CspA family protein
MWVSGIPAAADRPEEIMSDVLKGAIKRMIRDRGFGFIREEGTVREFFFHRRDCLPTSPYHMLREGDSVRFQEIPDEKGPRAVEVGVVGEDTR